MTPVLIDGRLAACSAVRIGIADLGIAPEKSSAPDTIHEVLVGVMNLKGQPGIPLLAVEFARLCALMPARLAMNNGCDPENLIEQAAMDELCKVSA